MRAEGVPGAAATADSSPAARGGAAASAPHPHSWKAAITLPHARRSSLCRHGPCSGSGCVHTITRAERRDALKRTIYVVYIR